MPARLSGAGGSVELASRSPGFVAGRASARRPLLPSLARTAGRHAPAFGRVRAPDCRSGARLLGTTGARAAGGARDAGISGPEQKSEPDGSGRSDPESERWPARDAVRGAAAAFDMRASPLAPGLTPDCYEFDLLRMRPRALASLRRSGSQRLVGTGARCSSQARSRRCVSVGARPLSGRPVGARSGRRNCVARPQGSCARRRGRCRRARRWRRERGARRARAARGSG